MRGAAHPIDPVVGLQLHPRHLRRGVSALSRRPREDFRSDLRPDLATCSSVEAIGRVLSSAQLTERSWCLLTTRSNVRWS
jgi:hypothetical protein